MAMNKNGLPVLRAAELATVQKQNRWLINGLWAASGVGVIGGSPKSGKSWLGLELAVSVATGTDCLGRFAIEQPGTVIVYLAEDALHMVRERLVSLCIHHHWSIDNLDVLVITAPCVRLDREDHIQKLEQTVKTYKPKMLLLDPFVRLHTVDENNAQEVARILNRLRILQRTYELSIIIVHHTRKSGSQRQSGMALRGSGDFWAWGDSNLYVTSQVKCQRLVVEHRAAPAPEPLTFSLGGDPPHLSLVEVSEEKEMSLDERVIDILHQAQSPMTRTEMRQRLAVNNNRLGLTLQKLSQNRQIHRTKYGWERINGVDSGQNRSVLSLIDHENDTIGDDR